MPRLGRYSVSVSVTGMQWREAKYSRTSCVKPHAGYNITTEVRECVCVVVFRRLPHFVVSFWPTKSERKSRTKRIKSESLY